VSRKDDLGEWGKGIPWIARHKKRQGAETRKDFLMWRVFSCDDGIGRRWRTELELSSRKPFDAQQRTTAPRASSKIAGTGGGDLHALISLACRS
jgi:hypothetical protein